MTQQTYSDPFGFKFWLGWILCFVLTFLAAAGFWTLVLQSWFGKIEGPELTLTWCLAVFGCWFLALIPFIRKKEQIWKRLNIDQERAVNAVIQAVSVFLFLAVASCVFWTWFYRDQLSSMQNSGMNMSWLKAVICTWLAIVMPFMIYLYRKADQIYKLAQARQGSAGPRFKSSMVEQENRVLGDALRSKLKKAPPTLRDGHIVTVILKDGTRVPNVFVLKHREILGVYDRDELGFISDEIVDIEPIADDQLPEYQESRWLRVDGRA